MTTEAGVPQEGVEHEGDEVQVFDVAEALRHFPSGEAVALAQSSRSEIALIRMLSNGQEPRRHRAPDPDEILVVLAGEGRFEDSSGGRSLQADQGMLIPASAELGLSNPANEELLLLSMRTEQTDVRGRNVPSDVVVPIPADLIDAKGIGHTLFAYCLDCDTIGISPLLMEEWNVGSLLRMNCEYERAGGILKARLPRRMVDWYHLGALAENDYQLVPDDARTRVRLELRQPR